jgi:hypothetical protein
MARPRVRGLYSKPVTGFPSPSTRPLRGSRIHARLHTFIIFAAALAVTAAFSFPSRAQVPIDDVHISPRVAPAPEPPKAPA